MKPVRDALLLFPQSKIKADDSKLRMTGVKLTSLVSKLFIEMRSTDSPSVALSNDLLVAALENTFDVGKPPLDYRTTPFTSLLVNVVRLINAGLHNTDSVPVEAEQFLEFLYLKTHFTYSKLMYDVGPSGELSIVKLVEQMDPTRSDNKLANPPMIGVNILSKDQDDSSLLPKTLTLDMYYADGSQDVHEKRSKTLKLQKIIAGLQAENVTRASGIVAGPGETKEEKKEHKEESKEEMTSVVTSVPDQRRNREAIAIARRKIDEIWKDGTCIYELTTVVIAEKGQFILYQRDSHLAGRWQKFSDGAMSSDVSEGNVLRRISKAPYAWASYVQVHRRALMQGTPEISTLRYHREDFHLTGGEYIQFRTLAGMTPTYVYLDPISLQLICHTSSKGPTTIDPAQVHFHVGTITAAHRTRKNPSMAAIFQSDGNLVIELYDEGAPPSVVFSTRTNGHSDILVLGGEHRLDLYDFKDGHPTANNWMTEDNDMIDAQVFPS